MLLLASGFLTIGSALLLGNNQATATLGSNTNTSEGQITFSNINAQYLSKHFSKTHFTLNGNNFGGGIIWLPTEELSTPQSIRINNQINNQTYTCSTKIRGYYYNSQRGERLWPLDEKTKDEMGENYKNLILE